jgi:hypothetical protein
LTLAVFERSDRLVATGNAMGEEPLARINQHFSDWLRRVSVWLTLSTRLRINFSTIYQRIDIIATRDFCHRYLKSL